jgi:hypothetical protein
MTIDVDSQSLRQKAKVKTNQAKQETVTLAKVIADNHFELLIKRINRDAAYGYFDTIFDVDAWGSRATIEGNPYLEYEAYFQKRYLRELYKNFKTRTDFVIIRWSYCGFWWKISWGKRPIIRFFRKVWRTFF